MLLIAILLVGCAHTDGFQRSGEELRVPDEAALGWRLVPGQEISYAHTARLIRGGDEFSRTEHWSYLVREVNDDGVALLEGRATGLGVLVKRDDELLSRAELEPMRTQEKDRLHGMSAWLSCRRGF